MSHHWEQTDKVLKKRGLVSPKQQQDRYGLTQLPPGFGAGTRFAKSNGFETPSEEQIARSKALELRGWRGMVGPYYAGEGRPSQQSQIVPSKISPYLSWTTAQAIGNMVGPSTIETEPLQRRRFRPDVHRMSKPIVGVSGEEPAWSSLENLGGLWKKGIFGGLSTFGDVGSILGILPTDPKAPRVRAVFERRRRLVEQQMAKFPQEVLKAMPEWQRIFLTVTSALGPEVEAVEAGERLSYPIFGFILAHQSGWQEPGVGERFRILQQQEGGHSGIIGRLDDYARAYDEALKAGEIPLKKRVILEGVFDLTNVIPLNWGLQVLKGGKKTLVSFSKMPELSSADIALNLKLFREMAARKRAQRTDLATVLRQVAEKGITSQQRLADVLHGQAVTRGIEEQVEGLTEVVTGTKVLRRATELESRAAMGPAIEVSEALSVSNRADFDSFNNLTPTAQTKRMQTIHNQEVRSPGKYMGHLKGGPDDTVRQVVGRVGGKRGNEVPEGNLLAKEGIWDFSEADTIVGTTRRNIIVGLNARTSTGAIAQSLNKIDVAESRKQLYGPAEGVAGEGAWEAPTRQVARLTPEETTELARLKEELVQIENLPGDPPGKVEEVIRLRKAINILEAKGKRSISSSQYKYPESDLRPGTITRKQKEGVPGRKKVYIIREIRDLLRSVFLGERVVRGERTMFPSRVQRETDLPIGPGGQIPSGVTPKRIKFTAEEYQNLKVFIQEAGVAIDSDVEMIGRFEISPVYGDRQFIVAAYNDPSRMSRSGLPEKMYITYNPTDKTWGIQSEIGTRPTLVDQQTGANLSRRLESKLQQIDNQISDIEVQLEVEPIWSPRYRALNGKRQHLVMRRMKLEEDAANTVTAPEPSPTLRWTAEEVDSFTRIHDDIYGDQIRLMMGDRPEITIPGLSVPGRPIWHVAEPIESGLTEGPKTIKATPEAKVLYKAQLEAQWITDNPVKASEEGLNKARQIMGLPPGNRGPAISAAMGATPGDSAGYMDELLHASPTPQSQKKIFSLWEGSHINNAVYRKQIYRDGQSLLKKIRNPRTGKMGIGTAYKTGRVMTKEDSMALYQALQGEGPVPEHLRGVYDYIQPIMDKAKSDMLGYDPSLMDFLPHPQYFPRFWKIMREDTIPEALGGVVGQQPGFLRARKDMTFTQMVKEGYEPISWNPFDMLVMRLFEGDVVRETMLLADAMRSLRAADGPLARQVTDKSMIPTDGYRIPLIGPVFEGRPYYDHAGYQKARPAIAVPHKIADILEGVYGKGPTLRVTFGETSIDILPYIKKPTQFFKSMLLFASGFQHYDVGIFRTLYKAFTPTGLGMRGWDPRQWQRRDALIGPRRWLLGEGLLNPSSWNNGTVRAPLFFRMLRAMEGEKAIKATEARMNSSAPLYPDSDISFAMVGKYNWQRGADTSILQRNGVNHYDGLLDNGPPGKLKLAADRLAGAVRFWQGGLFDVVYRESQMFMLENYIIPKLRRSHPTWTSEEVAMEAAEHVNVFSSSLAASQTILTSPVMREGGRLALFSPAETETWFKMAIRPFVGTAKGMYQEDWVGMFTYLILVSNTINYLSTGEFMPASAYSPISFNEPNSDWPGGVGYNTRFMSPEAPWKGSDGQPVYLDLVGQADNVFRIVLGWKSGGITSRLNWGPRQLYDQLSNESFFGEPLEGPVKRLVYAATSMAPMGAQNVIQLLRAHNAKLSSLVLQGEQGLDPISYAVQAITGLNVGSANATEIHEELALASGFKSWDDMGRNDKEKALAQHPRLANQLTKRTETAARRELPYGVMGKAVIDNKEERRTTEDELYQAVLEQKMSFRDVNRAYNEAKNMERIKNQTAWKTFEKTVEPREAKTPNAIARKQYFGAWDTATTGSIVNWDLLESLLAKLHETWTPEQIAHIEENTGTTSTHPHFRALEDLKRKYRWYFEIEEDAFKTAGLWDKYKEWRASPYPNEWLRVDEAGDDIKAVNELVVSTRKYFREKEVQGIDRLELLLMLIHMGRPYAEQWLELQTQVGYTGKSGVPMLGQ